MNTKDITKHLRTWIEVDTKAIDSNLALARSMLPESTKIMAVVKSNAYGHGLFDFAAHIASRGVSWIGVDSITEAVALRKNGITLPILVMGYSLAERFSEAVEHDISVTISNMVALQEAINFSHTEHSKKLKIHIKIDTGLHRQGFLQSEVVELIDLLQKNKDLLNIEGIYTHLADAKREEGVDYSEMQKKIFDEVRSQFTRAGFTLFSHISASPALIRFGDEFFAGGDGDIVRLGAILYGMYPSDHMQVEFEKKFTLHPALSWKTIISELKQIPKGSSVGYNRSETVERDTLIGICPIGYWHGYPGVLSSQGIVLVNSAASGTSYAAKILGRVSMDMITIDCTDCPGVKIGDEVTLIDSNPKSPASVRIVAEKAGVSIHELLTRLNPKIKRIFL